MSSEIESPGCRNSIQEWPFVNHRDARDPRAAPVRHRQRPRVIPRAAARRSRRPSTRRRAARDARRSRPREIPTSRSSARLARFSTNTRDTSFQKPAATRRLDQRLHRQPPGTAAAVLAVDVDRELRDPGVALARPVLGRARKRDHLAAGLDDDDREAPSEPGQHVVVVAQPGLERRRPLGNALVVDPGDRRRVATARPADPASPPLRSFHPVGNEHVRLPFHLRVPVRREHQVLAVRREHRESRRTSR